MTTPIAPAAGETSLATLLAEMKPTLHADTFVFCTIPPDAAPPGGLAYQMIFREAEGTTIVISEASASSHDIPYTFKSRMITLQVHSSLDAIGFLAAITARLTAEKMGVNPVSGFYHDHLFVPVGRELDAMKVLDEMSQKAKRDTESESLEAKKLKEMIDGLITGQKGDWSGKT